MLRWLNFHTYTRTVLDAKLVALLVAVACVACGDSPAAPVDPYEALIGNWTLVKLNHHAPLPVRITNDNLISIVSGSLVIGNDHHFALTFTDSDLDSGPPAQLSNGSLAGVVTDSSSLITLATGPAPNGPGLSFNAMDSAGALIRFAYNSDVFDFVRDELL